MLVDLLVKFEIVYAILKSGSAMYFGVGDVYWIFLCFILGLLLCFLLYLNAKFVLFSELRFSRELPYFWILAFVPFMNTLCYYPSPL